MVKNFWRLRRFSFLFDFYAYIDHGSYLADALFVQKKVTVKFLREMAKEGSPFCIVFCRVKKRDSSRFEEALSMLDRKMLLFGYHDYSSFCNELIRQVEAAIPRLRSNQA